MTNYIFEFIRVFILTIWFLIGPIFWIPFLSRMIVYFTSAVLVSVSNGSNMQAARLALDRAVRFYPEGFTEINKSIDSLVKGETSEEKSTYIDTLFIQELAIHLFFSLIFWFSTLFIITKWIN